ncbi:hypothetical protein QUF64_02345 [Anaerolineales bacterium HSG6]|nr:hypothetical protein [Anaerolineales bacterium HSG6]MDM8529812.1 hypothetical protein [Anaerolineales bacterium HSG25]
MKKITFTWIMGMVILVVITTLGLTSLTATSAQATSIPMRFVQPTDCVADGIPYAVPDLTLHQIYNATSVDGLTFSANNIDLLSQASEPDGVLSDAGLQLYFVNGQQNQYGIWLAQQVSNGSFELVNCIKLDGSFNNQLQSPDVVRLADGQYRLFYVTGNSINSAISSDGQNFSYEQESVAGATSPSVVQLADGSWLMAYSNGSEIGFVSSADGLNFTPTDSTVSVSGSPELMVLPTGQLRLLIGQETMQSYLSEDNGSSWTLESPSVVIQNQTASASGQKHPSVVAMPDSSWTLIYVALTEATTVEPISGQILLQGRENYDGTEIYLSMGDCTTSMDNPPTTLTNSDGTFEVDTTTGQSYQCLQAKRPGYLLGQKLTPTGDVGSLTLLGGDVNGDNIINIFDLAQIAANYESNDPTYDINGDGVVDIFDLTMTAINYNKRGPIEE